jgi:hypothetical protein
MAYSSVIVPRFGALRLDADPGDLGLAGAVDLLNVEFDPNGTVRTRPGFDQTDANTTANPQWLVRNRADSQYVLIGTGDLRAYDATTLASVDSDTGPTSATHAVEYGGSSGGGVYIMESANGLSKYDGTTFTNLADPSTALKYLAVQPNDNRLVLGVNSTIKFSEPDDPESYLSADSVNLHLNDGQQIRMMLSWGNNLFVFKDAKFFVFYGNSVNAAGGTDFNYRAVDTGVGCGFDFAACSAQDGIYFVHQDGVYRTTGGTPELVSGALQPFFDGRTNGFFTPTAPLTAPRIHAGDDRLYVWQKGAAGMFVMDLRSREWMYWVLGVAPYALLPLPDPREFLFVNSTGQLYKFSPDYTTDDGTVIPSHYQSGFAELAEGKETHVRDFDVWGTGTVTHQIASDFGAVDAGTSLTLGTAPAVELSFDTLDRMGRNMAFKFTAASGAWAVARWMARIKGVRDWT